MGSELIETTRRRTRTISRLVDMASLRDEAASPGRCLQTRRMDLKVERIWRNRHVQHFFEIPFNTLTPEQRLVVDDFFVSVRGRMLGNIDFQDPWDGIHYTCRMELDEQSFEEPDNKRWSATVRLIEVASFKALKPAVPAFPTFASGAVVQLPYRMTSQYRTVVERQQDDSEKTLRGFRRGIGDPALDRGRRSARRYRCRGFDQCLGRECRALPVHDLHGAGARPRV